MRPYIGMGATYAIGTDRHPMTIVAIDGERIGAAFDTAYGAGVFDPALDGEPQRWFVPSYGTYRLENARFGRLELGRRDFYQDPTLSEER